MKLLMITALVLGLVSVSASAQAQAPLKTRMDSVSYSIGQQVGDGLKRQKIDVNAAALVAGLQDALKGESSLKIEQMQACLNAFQQELMAKQQVEAAAAGEKNQKEGAAFLAANKQKKGVKTTASGLQYEVLKEGAGPMPKATDQVTVHYKGTLIDGTVFDSSIDRGEPATFPVNGVIQGWVEALQLMKVGSKYRLVIPSELAYGQQGAGGTIGPNAVLVFEVELLAIK